MCVSNTEKKRIKMLKKLFGQKAKRKSYFKKGGSIILLQILVHLPAEGRRNMQGWRYREGGRNMGGMIW